MGRIEVVREVEGVYPYYVEVWDIEKGAWKAQVRYYKVEQDLNKFPDNKSRRNFKSLNTKEDE